MFGGIPFESFGGGMPGGMGMSGGDDVDTTKLYETLEVEKDADQKEIKKAYRKLSRTHHPDKGGDEHKFKEINAAYEILSDPDKRKAYDRYGLEGVSEDGRASTGEDLFSMFFGGGRGRGGRSAGPRKGPNVNHPIKVSLEDLYMGKTVKLAVNRKVIVSDVKECDKCDGQGMKMEIRQIGPGMISQVQRPCADCHGQGSTAKTKNERKVLEVHIDKGMPNQKRITFRGMADEIPGMETGDVNFIIQEKPHDLFQRKGADLLLTKNLSLNQALCGFKWKIKHLDGRHVIIKTKPGEIIQCEMKDEATGRTLPYIKMVKDEGMPSYGNPFVKGNLYISFHITFPKDGSLSPEVVEILKKALPDPDEEDDDSIMHVVEGDDDANPIVDEVTMDAADLSHFGRGGAAVSGSEYDSDDEGGGGPVQCQQS